MLTLYFGTLDMEVHDLKDYMLTLFFGTL